jgi:ABC-type multidrug transport system permease subunit
VRKDLLHIIREPRNLFLVTVAPAFLLVLLANIFTFGVSQFNLAILDLDRTPLSRRYVASLTNDQDWTLVQAVQSYEEIEPLLVGGEVDAALVIPPGFAKTVTAEQPAQVQALIDGTDPLASAQAIGSLSSRSSVFVVEASEVGLATNGQLIEVRNQAWYNAGLESLFGMVPALLAVVLIMPTMALALALARERETGTFEGLTATPILGIEYLTGKLVAYIATGLVSSVLALLVAVMWFQVPFRGSLAVFVLLAADYFLACMGAVVVMANFVKSQQTAMFIVLIIYIVPSFFLSGIVTPPSRESVVSLLVAYALPSTHFVEISRELFLKGLGLSQMARPALALLGMGLGALVIALLTFRKKVL